MCGIAGVAFANSEQLASLDAMVDCLYSRGPNDRGMWQNDEHTVALGHRRLAIVDLSAEGHQPMQSTSQRYTIVFNGEIYNFQMLRKELLGLGHQFRGGSDTEVLLACIEQWGLAATLPKLVGMFAFALWDRVEQCLYLARDRFGEKPLYYGWLNQTFIFASELKALNRFTNWRGEINSNVLSDYLQYSCIPAPYSIYKDIYKLIPGTYLTVKANRYQQQHTYWSALAKAQLGLATSLQASFAEATDQLEQLLKEVVAQQMVADVPIGAFLSGGIDSSTVVALMQTQSTKPVKTFSIGFAEQSFNEAPYAKAVAEHLGTEHTELYVSAADALNVVPNLPTIYDEPFADSSQIPTYLISKLTRQHVTVSLSGDGGDELFGGYDRFMKAQYLWQKLNKLPAALRTTASYGINTVPGAVLDWLGRQCLPANLKNTKLSDRRDDIVSTLRCKRAEQFYLQQLQAPGSVHLARHLPQNRMVEPFADSYAALQHDMLNLGFYIDTVSYLPDDILVKVDRAGMAVSLETRIPLLDHRVYEFAWRLSKVHKVQGEQGKLILKNLLARYVPKALFERPKQGFSIPLSDWLRGPLRLWAEDLLQADCLTQQGYFNVAKVRDLWALHLRGETNRYQTILWNVLMFQAWLHQHK